MILWFRLLLTIVRGLVKGKVDVMGPYSTEFRAYPLLDGETNSLNAARYFSFCELAINEVNVRNGFSKLFIKAGMIGVTCNVTANYIRPVYVFKKFQATTEVLGWDDKFIYRRNRIHQNGELKFEALYKIMIRNWKNRFIAPSELVEKMGYRDLKSPELPSTISLLQYRANKT